MSGNGDEADLMRMCGLTAAVDPSETLAASDLRTAKALFVPWLKRDIVLSITCTQPPAGGIAW